MWVSSNINEVIRAVLNFLLFFYEKILHAPKATKSTKSTKRHKGTQTKAQKRELPALKAPKRTKRYKDTQAKAQNANKRISDYFPLGYF